MNKRNIKDSKIEKNIKNKSEEIKVDINQEKEDLIENNIEVKELKVEDISKIMQGTTNNVRYNLIKKLICNYQTFKEERTKAEMPVAAVCEVCKKSFDLEDEIYVAIIESDNKQILICKNCAKAN